MRRAGSSWQGSPACRGLAEATVPGRLEARTCPPPPARPLEVGEAGPSGEFTLQPGSAPLLAHKCGLSLRLRRPVSLLGGEEEGGSGHARSSQPGEAGRSSQELLGSALQERRVQEAVGAGIPRRRNSTCKALSL